MSRRQQIHAEVPPELQAADDLLQRYGRSVMDRFRKQHCASAEGRYAIPPNDDDREPREVLLSAIDVTLVQRALMGVAERERTMLNILYVPQRLPAEAQLRMKRIPTSLAASRHLDGLKQFSERHRIEMEKSDRAAGGLRRILRRSVVESAFNALSDATE